jgi:hypothetical protein
MQGDFVFLPNTNMLLYSPLVSLTWQVVNFLLRKWVQSISQGSNCPALLESMNPYHMAHQFVVRSSTHEAKERQILVQVKPHQNFIRDFYNWLLGFMMKQRSQPKI